MTNSRGVRLAASTESTPRPREECTTSPTRFVISQDARPSSFPFYHSPFSALLILNNMLQERLGKSEVQLVQTMIDGVNKLIEIEAALAAGKPAPTL